MDKGIACDISCFLLHTPITFTSTHAIIIISYKQLKRIKNFFDNFKGKHIDPQFMLNGEFKMKNWVNNQLRQMREGIHQSKKIKSDTGMQNQFIQNHTKDGIDVRPSKEHSRTVDKYNTAVTESLRRINELISKI
jgi:hypothetical protein